MPSLIVHCFDAKHRDLLKLEDIAEVQRDSGNPLALFVNYDATQADVLNKRLDKFSKTHPLEVLREGHAADGNIRAHVRVAPDAEATRELHVQERAPVDAGNLPTLFGTYYGYPAQQGLGPNIAVISLGGTFLTSDMQTFWSSYLGRAGSCPPIAYVNTDAGSHLAPNQPITANNSGESQENTLDLQILLGLCPAASIKVYFGSNTTMGFYTAFSRAMSDTQHRNSIISCSWGAPESSFGSLATAFSSLFQRAVASGITICGASGDNGSGDGAPDKLQVDFPASSPYVVSCGGTSVNLATRTETVWSWSADQQWGTGGGVSALFPRPAYQKGLVTSPADARALYRSVPDIALNADPLQGWSILFNGHLYKNSFGGTSCAAPAFAAYLGLCNKSFVGKPFGVLNSLWARVGGPGFKDIVSGNNASVAVKPVYYQAHAGPDQCTGLGSIHGTSLLSQL
jgi:kumamolisin